MAAQKQFKESIEKGDINSIRLLILNPNVNVTDDENYAIRVASINNHFNIVSLLWKINKVKETLQKDNINLYEELMKKDIISKQLAFKESVNNNDVNSVKKMLLDPSVNPSLNLDLALRDSAWIGYTEMVELLLTDPRVNPCALNNYAIRYASARGNIEIVKLLLADPRVNPADGYNYSVNLAAECGHFNIVELLLSDPRVNPTDSNNHAIIKAESNNHPKIVELLWGETSVKKSLKNNDINLYNQLMAKDVARKISCFN